MVKKSVLIALGGNAILQAGQRGTFEEQQQNIEIACRQIVEVIKAGYKVILTHGNGPQIGNLLIQNENCAELIPPMPLDVCGAQSQGFIGYMIQQVLGKVLRENNCQHEVATIITQVVVDRVDPAFKNPTKPIGGFFSEDYARKMMIEKSELWVEDAGRGWRKIVPSPQPQKIVETKIIEKLINDDVIVIASGGGGIPVIEEKVGIYKGIEAVIDKDLSGQSMAVDLNVDIFMILTDVAQVALNFGKPNQKWLESISQKEAYHYQHEGHFQSGSMGPKMNACIQFVEQTQKVAIITSIGKAMEAIQGTAGTKIVYRRY